MKSHEVEKQSVNWRSIIWRTHVYSLQIPVAIKGAISYDVGVQ